MNWWSKIPQPLMPLIGVAFALLSLALGAVLTLALSRICRARIPPVEDVGGFRLFHRSRSLGHLSPQQVWIKLQRTLILGWVARAWLLGASILALVIAVVLALHQEIVAAVVIGAGGILFLPVLIVVWDEGHDVHLICDAGQGVLFSKEVHSFYARPAQVFLLRDLARVVLRQEGPPGMQRAANTGYEEFDRAQELWRVPRNWILEITRREGEPIKLMAALNYRFLHDIALQISQASRLPLVETEEDRAQGG